MKQYRKIYQLYGRIANQEKELTEVKQYWLDAELEWVHLRWRITKMKSRITKMKSRISELETCLEQYSFYRQSRQESDLNRFLRMHEQLLNNKA